MSEKTVYGNISPNSTFSIYSIIGSNAIDAQANNVAEVMGYNDRYWYIDHGYCKAIDALLSNDAWPSDDFERDSIGELKFTFTIKSHPEFFI